MDKMKGMQQQAQDAVSNAGGMQQGMGGGDMAAQAAYAQLAQKLQASGVEAPGTVQAIRDTGETDPGGAGTLTAGTGPPASVCACADEARQTPRNTPDAISAVSSSTTVTIGPSAFRSACLSTTSRDGRPRRRASPRA